MSTLVESNLALILFLPWFLILTALYWIYPRQPRHAARRLFDVGAIVLSVIAFVLTIHWAQSIADASAGRIWRQVLATSLGYGAFLAVLTLALIVRWRWLKRA